MTTQFFECFSHKIKELFLKNIIISKSIIGKTKAKAKIFFFLYASMYLHVIIIVIKVINVLIN